MLLLYYFCAETWFPILFTVIVEIVNPDVKAIMSGLTILTITVNKIANQVSVQKSHFFAEGEVI